MGWLAGWLVGWLVSWLVGWLVGWLVIRSVFSVSPRFTVGPKEHGFTEKADRNGHQRARLNARRAL